MTERAQPGLIPLPSNQIDIWFLDWDPSNSEASPYRVIDWYATGGPRLCVRRLSSGKPVVDGVDGIGFSLSHSGAVAAVAVGRHCQVGIDIERIHPLDRLERLAQRFLSPEEARAILDRPPPARLEAFFRTWVRKEAYLKGLGGGVPSKLRAFTINEGSDGAPKVRSTCLEGAGMASAWSITDLKAPAGYVAALAVDREIRGVHVRSYKASETSR